MVRSGPALTCGNALTFTMRDSEFPVQNVSACPVGVKIYSTSISKLVVLIRVSLMADVEPEAVGLLIPDTAALVQVNVVPARLLVIE